MPGPSSGCKKLEGKTHGMKSLRSKLRDPQRACPNIRADPAGKALDKLHCSRQLLDPGRLSASGAAALMGCQELGLALARNGHLRRAVIRGSMRDLLARDPGGPTMDSSHGQPPARVPCKPSRGLGGLTMLGSLWRRFFPTFFFA